MAVNKTQVNGELENVRVVIRVRPLNKKEVQEGHQSIVIVDRQDNVISLVKPNFVGEKPKSFKFDCIFPEDCTQMDLYQHIAFPIVEKVLQGYNGTIFAYGQTGTGKTYTMAGKQNSTEYKGIIPNTFSHIFNRIAKYSGQKSFRVTITYLEIYNEDVRDLLSSNPNAKLEVRERLDVGVYVKDLMGFTVDSIESITELMNRGNTNRMTKSTLMNDVSSRSHAIFTITIESKDKVDNKMTIAKLNLVDLAGSERLSRTQATGEALKEASNINQSLSVLGIVISALVDEKSTHIPYRNSKLTRLLQDSLGGNSKTAMIAMISPSEIDYEESLCTLRYASRVKYVKNQVRENVKPKKNIIALLEQDIAKLTLSLVTLRKEKEALVLERNRDKELYERFQKTENIETTDYFDDRKSIADYSSDDDTDNYDLKAETDLAMKRFCNFLIRQAPGNTLSSILKIYALRELRSYHSKDNLCQSNSLGEISDHQPMSYKLKKSKSTPHLRGITRASSIRRSQSLNCVESVNLSEDFIEINSIRVGLERLQSLFAGNTQNINDNTVVENHDTTLTSTQSRNDDVLNQLQHDCEDYMKTIKELTDKLEVLSRKNADLDGTNIYLQMQVRQEKDNSGNLNDHFNAALRRVGDLLDEKEELKNEKQKLNEELDYYKHVLKEFQDVKIELKEKNEEVARLARELSIANDNISKLECEAGLSKHRESSLYAQIQNKDDTIAQLEKHNQQLEANKESLKITLKDKLNEANEDKKRNEDKLTLVNVRLKCLEDNLISSRNQNNNLRKTNQDFSKTIEDQRQEILNLRNLKEININCLTREIDKLRNENQQMLLNLHSEIALKNEMDNALRSREEKINESLHATQELKNRISQLEKENIKLRVIVKDENDLKQQTLQELKDSKQMIANLKKAEQAMEINMKAKDNEALLLKIELTKTQTKLSNTIKDLEYATSNCECKKSARKSLSDRRRFEKNILQDSRRNINEDNIENDLTKPFDAISVKSGRIQNRSESIMENGSKEHQSNSKDPEILQKYEQLKTVAKRQQGKIEELEKQVESTEYRAKYLELSQKYDVLKCVARRRHARITELEKQLKIIPTTLI